jgi:hypothetical protein
MEIRVDLHKLLKPEGKYSSCTKFMLYSAKLPASIISYDTLKRLGFIDVFLYDETEGNQSYYKDCILLVFNPSVSFWEGDYGKLKDLMKSRPNFLKEIEYGYCVGGFWLKIGEEFGKNLRWYYKKGLYSQFPKRYIDSLNDTEKRICSMDENYRVGLEKKLGVDEGGLEGIELASIPERKDYTFKFIKDDSR